MAKRGPVARSAIAKTAVEEALVKHAGLPSALAAGAARFLPYPLAEAIAEEQARASTSESCVNDLKITPSQRVRALLNTLRLTGLYGHTDEEVATRLIEERLRQLVLKRQHRALMNIWTEEKSGGG